jgi:hypothetical protein
LPAPHDTAKQWVEKAVHRTAFLALLMTLVCLNMTGAKADDCLASKDAISTDRPDVTNSSIVVPAGSLQSENGVNFSARDGGRFVDGTNTRWRLGIAPCFELLVDTPTYFVNIRGTGGLRLFRCRAGAQMADQSDPAKSRSLCGLRRGVADRVDRHSRPRRAALFAIPVVLGIAQRMGIERNVH